MHVFRLPTCHAIQVYRAKPDCDLYWHRREYLEQTVPHGAYVSTTPGKRYYCRDVVIFEGLAILQKDSCPAVLYYT